MSGILPTDHPIEIERVPLAVNRYRWQVKVGGGLSLAGWTFTKRGARRAARKAREERS